MRGTVTKLTFEALDQASEHGLLLEPETPPIKRALERLYNSGLVVRPHRGLYAKTSTWHALTQRERYLIGLRSLSLMHPDWIFCSYSAAALFGIDIPYCTMKQIHVVASRTGAHGQIYQHHLRNIEEDRIDGIPVVALERTVASIVDQLAFPHALGVVDAALRIKGRHAEELFECIDKLPGRGFNRKYVNDVVSYGDNRSENGGESYARAIMIEQGVMLPELQVEHYDPITGSCYRDDFEWTLAHHNIAGELDGMRKYTSIARANGKSIEDVMCEERQRESRLRNQGLQFARFTFEQVRQVRPFLNILDSCGIPRIGRNERSPHK